MTVKLQDQDLQDLQTMISLSSGVQPFSYLTTQCLWSHTHWISDLLLYYNCCKILMQSLHTNQEGQLRTCYVSSLGLIIFVSALYSSFLPRLFWLLDTLQFSEQRLHLWSTGFKNWFRDCHTKVCQSVCMFNVVPEATTISPFPEATSSALHPLLSTWYWGLNMRNERARTSMNHA